MPTTSELQPATDEAAVLEALRAGDERVFAELVDRYGSAMKRLARSYVRSEALAEEVVQDAWLGVLDGIHRFEGRSSLKTWIFRILVNRAKTSAVRQRRSVPFSELAPEGEDAPSIEPERFVERSGEWAADPGSWRALPEARLLARETLEAALHAIDRLPSAQRKVIVLRDVEGWSSDEVCDALELSSENQRVLLHRARSKVRAELDRHLQAA
jgi:RNA polymerase sigma-70 factor, ECF subfamily